MQWNLYIVTLHIQSHVILIEICCMSLFDFRYPEETIWSYHDALATLHAGREDHLTLQHDCRRPTLMLLCWIIEQSPPRFTQWMWNCNLWSKAGCRGIPPTKGAKVSRARGRNLQVTPICAEVFPQRGTLMSTCVCCMRNCKCVLLVGPDCFYY